MLAMITIVANEESPKLDGRAGAQTFSIGTKSQRQFEVVKALFDNRKALDIDPDATGFSFGVSWVLAILMKKEPTIDANLNTALRQLGVAIRKFLDGREFSMNNGIQGFFSMGSIDFRVDNS